MIMKPKPHLEAVHAIGLVVTGFGQSGKGKPYCDRNKRLVPGLLQAVLLSSS